MPGGNVRDVRRRVRSVQNIQQITRAMKFVAASKLRREESWYRHPEKSEIERAWVYHVEFIGKLLKDQGA